MTAYVSTQADIQVDEGRTMKKSEAVAIAGLLTVVSCLARTPSRGNRIKPRPDPDLPNFVIIFTDDQGYGDVGVFGAKGYTTPNLDRMAKEGRIFTNFHSSQP